jgi:hypothetical protein
MPKRNNDKPATFADVYANFMRTITVIGVHRIHESPYRTQRILWLCVVCVGLAATAYHAETMIAKYFGHPSMDLYIVLRKAPEMRNTG